jgi:hypothetical protein
MRKFLTLFSMVICMSLLFLSCKKDNPADSGPTLENCGGGQGYKITVTRQVDHYEAGYGVPNQDVISVSCLVGPAGATVSNSTNGTYYCSGTYKLATYQTATITLSWGGTTSYSMQQSQSISAAGQGTFIVKCTKMSGGEGNMFLSMASGSRWMFSTVLTDTP